MPYTKIDKEDFYKEKCQPLVDGLCMLCSINGIPLFISAAIKNNDEETVYKNDGVLTGSRNIKLKDDQIRYHMMIAGGCKAVPVLAENEIVMDDYLEDIDDYNDEVE